MDIKPVRTEEDYQAALNEIERLWGAEPGTPESDRFEVLVTLVKAYEDQHYKILPPALLMPSSITWRAADWTGASWRLISAAVDGSLKY